MPSKPVASGYPQVSLVVIQFGEVNLLRELLQSLALHPDNLLVSELVVVDNGASMTKDTVSTLRRQFNNLPIRIVDNHATSYASGVNRGVKASRGDVVIVCNNDVKWLDGSSIEPLLRLIAERGTVGVVGGQLVYPNGSWQQSFGQPPSIGRAVRSVFMLDSLGNMLARRSFTHRRQRRREVGYVSGALMAIRRACFEELGGFDETFPFYGEDVDFCYRARQVGWRVIFEPRTRVIHVRGASSATVLPQRFDRKLVHAQLELVKKHQGETCSRAYRRLMVLALWERLALYSVLAGGSTSQGWDLRARAARHRLMALRGSENE